jgi:hypothetical protein
VTLLFSDVEGSTRLLMRLGAAYVEVLDGQRNTLRPHDSWRPPTPCTTASVPPRPPATRGAGHDVARTRVALGATRGDDAYRDGRRTTIEQALAAATDEALRDA